MRGIGSVRCCRGADEYGRARLAVHAAGKLGRTVDLVSCGHRGVVVVAAAAVKHMPGGVDGFPFTAHGAILTVGA